MLSSLRGRVLKIEYLIDAAKDEPIIPHIETNIFITHTLLRAKAIENWILEPSSREKEIFNCDGQILTIDDNEKKDIIELIDNKIISLDDVQPLLYVLEKHILRALDIRLTDIGKNKSVPENKDRLDACQRLLSIISDSDIKKILLIKLYNIHIKILELQLSTNQQKKPINNSSILTIKQPADKSIPSSIASLLTYSTTPRSFLRDENIFRKETKKQIYSPSKHNQIFWQHPQSSEKNNSFSSEVTMKGLSFSGS